MKGAILMKGKHIRVLSLVLLAALLAGAVNLPGLSPAARAGDGFTILYGGMLVEYTGPGGIVRIPRGVKRIGTEVFLGRSDITGVVIPDTVTAIGEKAFYGCTGLKKVTLPKGLTEIGKAAFYGCVSLKKVTLPKGLTTIGAEVFEDCRNLTGITLPQGVTKIDYEAFWRCTSLTRIVIPSSVTSIGDCAFFGCTGLTSVVIPDSVTTIAEDAFGGCPNLRFAALPSEAQAPDFAGSNPATTVIPDNLLPPAIFLKVGQSMALPRFKGAKVTWSVDKPDVAAIVKNRTVRCLKGIDATLTLKVEQAAQGKALTLNGQPLKPGKEYEVVLTALAKGDPMATKVAINGPRKLTLHPLGMAHGYPSTAKLDLVLTPASLPGLWKAFCFYISSNPGVAQVLGDGTIVAVKPGKAVITAYTPNMKTAKVTVTVKGRVTSLRLKGEDNKYVKRLTLKKGQSRQFFPEFNGDAALKAVHWTSSNPTVAYVRDTYNYVYGNSKGTAKITATALDGSNKKATVVVTVTE